MAMSKGYRVLEKSNPPSPHSIILEHRNKTETLLFESQAIAVLSAQETEAVRKQYVKILDAYGCLGVLQLNAGESTILYLVMVTGCFSVGKIGDAEIFRITQTQFVSLQYQQPNEDKISEVRKFLNSGTFYFSWSITQPVVPTFPFDITLCAQRRRKTSETDNRFFWNRMLHIHLLRFSVDCGFWLLKAMCGSIEIRTVYAGSRQARASIVSRLSCERAGTRFNVRGTNDDGHVANFVETEQVIYLDGEVTSYLQTRGSVPLFWEQPGVQVGSHKVKMSRGFEATAPAFDRHMKMMKSRYGRQAIVNLLGTSLIGSKEGEAMLSNEFQRHHNESVHTDVTHIVFDYHQECRNGNTTQLSKLKHKLDINCQNFGIFYANCDNILREQYGTIRTNCLDCLDRTNCVQMFIGLEMLGEQVKIIGLADKKQTISRFEEVFRQMWVNNGNEVSKIYAGTGAIQGGSKLIDGARSAARTIQNNLLDNSKQEAIDILLVGSTLSSELADRARILLPTNMLHAPTPILREMCKRYTEFVNPAPLRISVGTYNVNGGKHFRSVVYRDVSLSDWLMDCPKNDMMIEVDSSDLSLDQPADIFAIGFQEIVDLNASNIMAASTDNAKQWGEELQKVLSSRDESYALLTSQQLVGVCLFVFVRPHLAQSIRDLATDCVKTGMGGATGNKGASAIRFVLNGTSFCFVAAHFAAGQSQVAERNADYGEITRKIAFPMGRTLKSHDYVFWCGDFNYRIDMDKDEMKELLKQGDIKTVSEFDQLKVQQEGGHVFNDFLEGEISFPPTYKYDLFSDDYDTSEKARAPAWTDRVLWKRRMHQPDPDKNPTWNIGKLIYYGRAELKQSDHRPVIAIVDVEFAQIDPDRRSSVFNDVINDLGPLDGTIVIQAEDKCNPSNTSDDEEDSIYDENLMAALVQELTQIGEVTLVRFVGETMWVTFKDGQAALTAAGKRQVQVCGVNLSIHLKTEDWFKLVEKEILLCTTNCVPLCDNVDVGASSDCYNSLGIPSAPDTQAKKGPPSRPPLPKSPNLTPKHQSRHQAGIVNVSELIRPQLPKPPNIPPALPDRPPMPIEMTHGLSNTSNANDQASSAIYEEIQDDIPQPKEAPPPLPSQSDHQKQQISPQMTPPDDNKPKVGVPPPLPMRRNQPPIPARSNQGPPLPARPQIP